MCTVFTQHPASASFLPFNNLFLCRLKFFFTFFKHSAVFIYKCFKTFTLLTLKFFVLLRILSQAV